MEFLLVKQLLLFFTLSDTTMLGSGLVYLDRAFEFTCSVLLDLRAVLVIALLSLRMKVFQTMT